MEYQIPPWSSFPLHNYSLQVIENGIVVLEKELDNKQYLTIGPDLSDIVISHDSIQSISAVLQHSDEGHLFIYPTASSLVKLNKKPVAKEKYEKVFPNDIIEIGKYPGILAVSGPSCLKRKDKFFTSEGKVSKNIRKSLQRVSWGFSEDAVSQKLNPDDLLLFEDDLNYDLIKRREDLTEKQRKTIQKSEKIQDQILLTRNELERSKNPEKTARLREKLESFQAEKEISDENLRSSFLPDYRAPTKVVKGQYDYSSSEDEFYNRVDLKASRAESSKQEVLDRLVCERNELTLQITQISLGEENKDEDSLDSFMQNNNWQIKEQSLLELGDKLRKINKEIDELVKGNPGLSLSSQKVEGEIKLGTKKRKVAEVKEELKTDWRYDWIPPDEEGGDGRTGLNEKYGY